MNDELYSRFDEALRAESALASNADSDQVAVSAVRAVRTRRRHRAVTVSAIALIAAPALAFTAYALAAVDGAVPAVTPSPSITAAPSPTPTPTSPDPEPSATQSVAAEPETWDDIPSDERPAYLSDQSSWEPRARAMEDWVWQYVDEDWSLVAYYDGHLPDLDGQALFLEAPDGDVLRLYALRTNFVILVGSWDPDARLAWLERHEGGDGFGVVQMDLSDGSLSSEWSNAAPESLQTDEGATSVRKVGVSPNGIELWAVVSYFTPPSVVMLREQDGTFTPSPSSPWLAEQTAQGRGDKNGNSNAETWIADDSSMVVYEALVFESRDSGEHLRSDARWLLYDVDAATVTEVTPQLPDGQACWAPRGPSGEETAPMVGSRVVAECDSGTFLIDPTGERAPEGYSG